MLRRRFTIVRGGGGNDVLQPNNQIWYTSSDGRVVTPRHSDVFGANIVSNTYENGKGVIKFDGDVTSIGYYGFYECESLATIIIPDSVTIIEQWAFGYCYGLEEVVVGSGVTSIESNAFRGNYLITSVTIPKNVTSIGTRAFQDCAGLAEIYVLSATPPTGANYMFTNIASNAKIYVPAGSGAAYKSAANWSSYASKIVEM